MAELDGRRALITGAGRGMGRAHAMVMAAQGAAVVVQDIDGDLANQTAALVREQGGAVEVMVGDISDVTDLKTKFAGIEPVDVLVNNAGIDRPGTLEEIDEAGFDEMFAIHVKGAFFATQAVVPAMKEKRWGKIVNISSVWGMVAYTSHSHYCGAKAALLGLTKAWAKELAPHNINVNAVAPGGVWTEMELAQRGEEGIRKAEALVPMGRWAQPQELSEAVLFLSTDRSSFITGQCISPNGGAVIVGI
ncbi:MAG: SDR family NAD(P)-dependent oxidoreductase [Alphaproteobacteria bacterium]|nr:SDR family oxidoreductase [Rhodospirillaceae bacterium]MBT6511514.1 SDR family oxidoreductase [Rhodospirillaceae bacterium]MBT7646204.1 SDR family oxidoreductase [Rhodospirillaceae bacterium]MDG2480351.1 SDR family NAD(P)-dependent oxidoreductase [Alphaproteobacteria bacterium]